MTGRDYIDTHLLPLGERRAFDLTEGRKPDTPLSRLIYFSFGRMRDVSTSDWSLPRAAHNKHAQRDGAG